MSEIEKSKVHTNERPPGNPPETGSIKTETHGVIEAVQKLDFSNYKCMISMDNMVETGKILISIKEKINEIIDYLNSQIL